MKKPESKKKFVISAILMAFLTIGLVLFFIEIKKNKMGNGNPWIAFAEFCVVGVSTMILCSDYWNLLGTFFSTIFGRNKNK